jgi:type II secretory pathway component GspD/PulD (secretin)
MVRRMGALAVTVLSLCLQATPTAVDAGVVVHPESTPCRAMPKVALSVSLDKVPLEAALQVLADLTCKTFSFEPSIKASVSINATDERPTPMNAQQLWDAVVAQLQAQGLRVVDGPEIVRVVRAPR